MRVVNKAAIVGAVLLAAGGGTMLVHAESPSSETPASEEIAAVMVLGEQLYQGNCVSCHGVQGEGPAAVLADSPKLSDIGAVTGQIIHGGHFMPRFSHLTDAQVAAVATYVRNSFGNAFGPVTEADAYNFR